MASGSIEGSGSYLHAYIYWSSAKGTGGSTVAADLHAKNVDGAWYEANLYGGYNLTINDDTKSGSGARLSGSANGSVLILSHSVWVGYTGNKSVTISAWIGSNGIYINGNNIGNRDCSGTATLDMVGSTPSIPTCTAPTTQVFTELGGNITIRWNKSSSYTTSGAGYYVDIQINNGSWNLLKDIKNLNTTSYTYAIPAGQGGTYRFRVVAYNPVGTSSEHSYSGVITRNSLSAPTIGTLNTYNPYVTSTLSVPLTGGSQANGGAFKRYADLYYGTTLLAHCATPSTNNNTSVSITYSAANFIAKLGASKYSDTFRITAWIQNSNGSRSAYVSKEFTVNINTDGGATPTLGKLTLSGGILGQAATCFVSGVNSIKVTVPNATLRRAPSGTTVSYKIECTGATVAIGQTATFSGLSAGTKTIKTTAIDSRGLSVSTTIQCVVQPWSAPRLTIESCERVSTATTTAKLVYSMTYTPIYTYPTASTQGVQLNSISLQQYNINGGSWNTASNNMIISGLSNELTYVINMRCADKVKTTTYSTSYITVSTINSLLSMRKWGCGINCIPQNGRALDVKGNSYLNGTVTTGNITTGTINSGAITSTGAVSCTSLTSSGDVSGASVKAGALRKHSYIFTGKSAASWFKLGTLSNCVNGKNTIIKVYTGSGYNGQTNQNGWVDIMIRTSNSTGTNGSYFGVICEKHGVNMASFKVKVIASSNAKCDIWCYMPWSYWDGDFTVETSFTWAYSGATQTSEPSGTAQSLHYVELFPVGSIYITTTNTNPSTFLGGTWTQFAQGRTLIGVGTGNDGTTSMSFTASSSGGKYKEILTIDQIPNHSHEQVVVADTHNNTGLRSDYNNDVQNGGAFPQGINTNPTGGGQSHNNIQPYISVYFWKRTA